MSMYMLRLLEKEDRTQTALVYKTVLCQKTGLEIIQELVEKALIAWNERTEHYCLTIAGKIALGRYEALRELI